jgi:hypothetical protein
MYACCKLVAFAPRAATTWFAHGRVAASKAESSAKLTACWTVVTVGGWLGTELNPFEAG